MMLDETVFFAAYAVVFPAWALLLFAPRWSGTRFVGRSSIASLLVAAAYVILLVTDSGGGEGDFWTLDGVAALFQRREVVLIGWLHYLAFDLFIGAWMVRDSARCGLHHLLVVPCLLLTFAYGPTGLLLYVLIRGMVRRTWLASEPE